MGSASHNMNDGVSNKGRGNGTAPDASPRCDKLPALLGENFCHRVGNSSGRPPMAPFRTGPRWFHRGSTICSGSKFFGIFLILGVFTYCPLAVANDCSDLKRVTVPPAMVVNQPDGDTFHIFTFDVPHTVEIRVQGVNTPEKPTKKRPSPNYAHAKEFTRQWLAIGPFTVTTCGDRSMSRVVGVVERDGRNLANELIDAGLGVPMDGR